MDLIAATSALAALSQSTRLETFRLLVRHEPEGLPAGEVARRLDIPQNTMSAHLAVLTRAGLAIAERQSRSIIYRADLNGLREVMTVPRQGLLWRPAGAVRPADADLMLTCCPAGGVRA